MIRGNGVRRFWSKTKRGPGLCIDWIGSVDKDGYGKFATGPHGAQRHHRPHRWIYERCVGPVGEMVLMHSCDRPCCVALQHLSPGTQKQNIGDSIAKGRHITQLDPPNRKLTPAQVRQVRKLREQGLTYRRIAEVFDVSASAVYGILTNRTWKGVA